MIMERFPYEYDELLDDQEVDKSSGSEIINHGYPELFAEYKDSRGKPKIETSWSIFNMAQSEDEMEITEDDIVHTHSEYRYDISLEEEIEKTPSTSSYDDSHPERGSNEEEETLDRDWGFTHFDVEISAWTAKYDQPDVSKLKYQNIDTLFKYNKALRGAFMAPMMVMSGSHSSKPCLNSNNQQEYHDNVSHQNLMKNTTMGLCMIRRLIMS